jgi:hypothetical protein
MRRRFSAVLEGTHLKLFTPVFTINKSRSVFELLLEKTKICQKTVGKCLVFLSYETFQKEVL